MGPFSQGIAGFMPFGTGGCTLCQSPMARQVMFFVALLATLWVLRSLIED